MSGVKRDCQCPRFKHQHGTYLAYESDKCRCFPCALAWSHAKARARSGGRYSVAPGLADATGTTRRIQALLALGWRHSDISARMSAHLGRGAHSDLILKNSGRVFTATAEAVAVVYDELAMSTGPSQRTRNRSRKAGYAPPLAWDDDSIDDPDAEPYRDRYVHAADVGLDDIAIAEAIRGRAVRLTPAERAEAVQRMTAKGYSAQVIAERLNVTQRCVVRRRTATGTERVA